MILSAHPFPQELQKQVFQFPFAAQLVQIRGKPLSVKGNLLGWSGQSRFRGGLGLTPCGKNILTLSRWRRTSADNVQYGSLVELIALNGTHLNECPLRFCIVVCHQLGTGQIQLLGRVFQNICQFRDELCQFPMPAEWRTFDASADRPWTF